jgi:iron complex outermembrane receptor protein
LLTPNFDVVNIGAVTMNGADAQLVLRPLSGLSLTNNVSYNHGVYDSDLFLDGVKYTTKNQQIVNYPSWMYKSRLEYDWKGLSIYADANYVGKRNYDYSGDLKLPSYWTASAGISYKIEDLGALGIGGGVLKSATISFNVSNLTNKEYDAISGVLGNATTASTGQYLQSIELSAPRMIFGTIKLDL